ncbi:uncharacterized protein LOC126841509 [Adelges cooleyi]|uniref:uncharacterized protein LOC126841509 n=1 Tax=Adelges cooleyi TaxID=133065 RepID=UPI00217F462C|nr:uncharacterized protein LOC126841509 [Adelges cooleyi]
MHLKHFIPFFCVTLYFLQCQGVIDTVVIDWIREKVLERAGGQNILNFDGMQTIFNDISEMLNSRVKLEKTEELKIARLYTKEQIEELARSYVRSEDPAVLERIAYVVNRHDVKGDGIYCLEQLKGVIGDIKIEVEEITPHYPNDEEITEIYSNRFFTKQQVEELAQLYVRSEDPAVLEKITNVVNLHDEKEDGTYGFEQVRSVIADLKIEFEEITVHCPSDEQLKQHYYNTTYTTEDVVTIIINNLLTE